MKKGWWWAVLALGAGLVAEATDGPLPEWKIGRAVIETAARGAMNQELNVKLSLRNEGRPGQVPVQILGRWRRAEAGSREAIPTPSPAPAAPAERWGAGAPSTPGAIPWGEMSGAAPPAPHRNAHEGFRTLGNYVREVALKQTAILDIPLRALGPAPPATTGLELVVLTGTRETDRHALRWPPS